MLYFLPKYNHIFNLFPVETHVPFFNNQHIWIPKMDLGLLMTRLKEGAVKLQAHGISLSVGSFTRLKSLFLEVGTPATVCRVLWPLDFSILKDALKLGMKKALEL